MLRDELKLAELLDQKQKYLKKKKDLELLFERLSNNHEYYLQMKFKFKNSYYKEGKLQEGEFYINENFPEIDKDYVELRIEKLEELILNINEELDKYLK